MTDVGLVLAAGQGRRLGGPKAPHVVAGERLVDRAVRVLLEAGCEPVLVVLGAWLGEVPGATVVVHDGWAGGLGSSLRAGLVAAAEVEGADRVVVVPVDLPGLTASAVSRVLANPGRLLAAGYDGRRGHPVVLGREHWAGVEATATGDSGARAYLTAREVDLVEVGDLASDADIDSA